MMTYCYLYTQHPAQGRAHSRLTKNTCGMSGFVWNACLMKAWVQYEQCCGTTVEGAAGCLEVEKASLCKGEGQISGQLKKKRQGQNSAF